MKVKMGSHFRTMPSVKYKINNVNINSINITDKQFPIPLNNL